MIDSTAIKFTFFLLLTFIVVACGLSTANAQSADAGAPALFDPVASVVMHPRCMNCHQIDAPHQNDNRIPHGQQVIGGADGKGGPYLKCVACHQTTNTGNGIVPGAQGWRLAPLSMHWEGLNEKQICEQMKDPARNGGRRTGEQVIEHMKADPVVLWAWDPGAKRTTPPLSHDKFIQSLETWANAGMPCPQ